MENEEPFASFRQIFTLGFPIDCFMVACGDYILPENFPTSERASKLCERINAPFESAVKKRVYEERKNWEEREQELRMTVQIKCPSCGFDGEGSVRSEGFVKAVREAEDRVWEEAGRLMCRYCRQGFPIEPNPGRFTHYTSMGYFECECSALRSRRSK